MAVRFLLAIKILWPFRVVACVTCVIRVLACVHREGIGGFIISGNGTGVENPPMRSVMKIP